MERSGKHGPKVDDELERETEGLVRGGGPSHAEEWKETEPVETDTGRDPTSFGTARPEGTPTGMTPRDVEERSALARALTGVSYPATRRGLAERAAENGAPDVAVSALEALPGEREFENLADVAEALGLGRETGRS